MISETKSGQGDIAIRDGVIEEVGFRIRRDTREEIDARGLHCFPGVIDMHVHFNDPGRAHWEGWATGSAAAAVGGTTSVAEMPLNASPPTLTAAAFDAKVAAATGASYTNFALWGGLTPVNLGDMAALAERGVIGFKAFMSNSGIDDFLAADDATLREGMLRAADLDLPVAVHAEDEALTAQLTAAARAAGKTGVRDWLETRPIAAELEAIGRALALAVETGCTLYVVHISSAAGAQMVKDALASGISVYAETCPHYLHFTAEDVEDRGALLKCSPPLRSHEERDKLRAALRQGLFDVIGSDHSPAPPEMKQADDFFDVWGGIAGAQSLLAAMLTDYVVAHHNKELRGLMEMLSRTPAEILGQVAKGDIAPGMDADLVLVDLQRVFTLGEDDLRYRHSQSPYVGFPFRGRPVRTLLRGVTIARDGVVVGPPQGRLLMPDPELHH